MYLRKVIKFPLFSGVRCLMMPYIQGQVDSVPQEYAAYANIIENVYIEKGAKGFLTIDESFVEAGMPHRGQRAKHGRALHTEAGIVSALPNVACWGRPVWGGSHKVTLDPDVQVLLANSISNSCAVWDTVHKDTTEDGDIGHMSHLYPYETATMMQAGEVHQIGIFTPHESLPVKESTMRQFLRIVSSNVFGRESYFTQNPLMV